MSRYLERLMRMEMHIAIDKHAARALNEIKIMADKARDEIVVHVGWMIRSNGQKRRWRDAQNGKN